MSTPCFDAMDDPDDDRAGVLDELQYWGQVINPDEWRGDVHASSEWEQYEPLAGPEYRLDWTGFYERPAAPAPFPSTRTTATPSPYDLSARPRRGGLYPDGIVPYRDGMPWYRQ